MAKIMIEAAINGNSDKARNPHIAYSPEDIAKDAIATCQAGAAAVHFHVREPDTGEWVQDVGYYSEVFRRTRAHCNPILWPTFPFGDDPVERFAHFLELAKDPATKPDLGWADPGSVNLVSYDARTKTLSGGNFIYQNSYDANRYFLEQSRACGVRPTLQIFDPSFLRAVLVFLDQGLLTEPLLLKFYFGGAELPFGLPPSLKSLEAYLDMLHGVRCNWFAATLGGDNLPFIPQIVSLGGHVRLGLEDYHYGQAGQLTQPATRRARRGDHYRYGPRGRDAGRGAGHAGSLAMAAVRTTRIAQVHASSLRAMLVVTGGGTQAIADLLAVPGASRTVLEVVVPYSETALAEFLGDYPDQAVSVETAAALARAAYKRAIVITRG